MSHVIGQNRPEGLRANAALQSPQLRSSLRLWLTAAAVIFGSTVALRWLFCHQTGDDEAFFALVGREWLAGAPPYAGVHDVKPPGLFALAALFELAFGPHVAAIKALEDLAVTITALALFRIGRRLAGTAAGLIAAGFYIVASTSSEGANQPAELVISALSALAFSAALGSEAAAGARGARFVAILAGLSFGLAVAVKQTAILEAAGFFIALRLCKAPNDALRGQVPLGVAMMAVAPFGFAVYFAAIGRLDDLFADTVVAAIHRNQIEAISLWAALRRLLPSMKPFMPLLLLTGLLWAERRRVAGERLGPARFISFWLGFAMLEAMAGRAMYGRYFLSLLPSLSLFSALFITEILGRAPPPWLRRPAQTAAVIGAAAYIFAGQQAALASGWHDGALLTTVTTELHVQGLRPGQRILVISPDLDLYLETAAKVETRFAHPMSLMCRFPVAGADAALGQALASRPNLIVLPRSANHRLCDLPQRWALLSATVDHEYCRVAEFARALPFAPDYGFIVYKRRSASSCAADQGRIG